MAINSRVTVADTSAAGPDLEDRAVLVVYDGEGREMRTRTFELPDGAQLTVGRAHHAIVQVDSEKVSRIHARVLRRGDVLSVEDMASRNGTWVNGVAITGTRRLGPGDIVVIGPAMLVASLMTPAFAAPRDDGSRSLEERLAAEIDRGHRYRRRFGLVRLRFANEGGEIDEAIDRVAAALRVMDVMYECAPSELGILLPELDAAGAADAARALADAARMQADGGLAPLEVSAGVAAYPEHGTTPGALIARAGAALESALRNRDDVGAPPPEEAELGATGPVVIAPPMRRVYELVHRVADHPITVLVYGETGVGKDVVACALHRASERRDKPLVRLNCASLPESLLESELFGHERGAFTGADRLKRGYFEVAHGGTLFLDEIGELSAGTQAKLLRVLEARQITRVGGTAEIEVDVRVVCATNRDLEAEVARGGFRSDLFFRISAFAVLVPPLRDRPEEIVPLAEHFLACAAAAGRRPAPALTDAAVAALRSYPWPGNVRELRNTMERAYVVHSDGIVRREDLPDRAVQQLGQSKPASFAFDGRRDIRAHVAELEREAIVAALEACGGSQKRAAQKLGVSRRALIYRMEKHGLKPPPASKR
jgi:two-component system, NtrC family, response regulator AtoC